jgi:capsid protein
MMPEPGTLYNLKPGQEIKFPEVSGDAQFEPVATSVLRAMAAGVGLTYDQATGDLRQANFSSLRAGKIEHRRFVEQVQYNHVIPRLCESVAQRFLDRAILAGSLRARSEGYRHSWVPPANEPIDPSKELAADIDAVRAGRLSPQEFIKQWGSDWKKIIASSEEFWKAVDKAKLSFDIDPRKPKAGAPAAPKPAGGAGGDDPSDPPTPDDGSSP